MTGNGLELDFPALAQSLPWTRLADLPTPLEDAPQLAARLGIGALAIKRDDRTSALYGGNKVRKLEYLLAEALATGCDSVVTYGSVGSNHALATTVFARHLGLRPHAVLLDQAASPTVALKLRYLLHLGAEIHPLQNFSQGSRILEQIRATNPGGARRVYDIPWGGSNWLGTVGFVAGALELARQCSLPGRVPPDFVYVSGGTLGTTIGLALGLRAAGLATLVVAPRAVPSGAGSAGRVAEQVLEFNRAIRARDPAFPLFENPLANVELRPEFYGTGYAEPTPESDEALALMDDVQGVHLDGTYTAKAFAGLVAGARAGRLADRRVVFWNTYNSAPYPAGLESVDTSPLPQAFRHYVDSPAGPPSPC